MKVLPLRPSFSFATTTPTITRGARVTKQALIYDNIQPLSDKHRSWSVSVENFNFVKDQISVPLLATEISLAAAEYPVIFSPTGSSGEYIPLAVMGLKEGQNLLVTEQGRISTRYIPAFIRRYPFVLASTNDDTLTVCIDEDSKACFPDGGKGKRLFDDNGEQTEYLKEVVGFLKDYQHRAEMTKAFCKKLHDLDLLEPMQAQIKFKDRKDADLTLGGFFVVRREKLKAISDADILDLFKKDGMELIYSHMQSLSNINILMNKMNEGLTQEALA
jgi:hypothetical protein